MHGEYYYHMIFRSKVKIGLAQEASRFGHLVNMVPYWLNSWVAHITEVYDAIWYASFDVTIKENVISKHHHFTFFLNPIHMNKDDD